MPLYTEHDSTAGEGSNNRYRRSTVTPCVCLLTGKVNLKVSAEALKTEALCGNEVATVPDVGRTDTVLRTLLVEVSDMTNLRCSQVLS